jgi:hypothetical protein
MQTRPLGFALGLALTLAAACGPAAATGPGTVVAPTDADAGLVPAALPDAAVADNPGKTPPVADSVDSGPAGPKLCGCALCEPLFSDDACASDADCAPSANCHADACVAKAKAPARPKNVMCTQILKCGSADANSCGCVQGKCALSPKAKP